MHNQSNRVFIGLLLAMSLAAAALVLSIPALFGSPSPGRVWIAGVLGVVTAALGITVLLLRPQRRGNRV